MLGGIGGHECLRQIVLDVIAMARPHRIQVQALEKNTLGHNGAEVALRYQPHEGKGVDDLIEAAGLGSRGDNRGVVRTKRCSCIPYGERAISLVYSDMRQDPT